MKTKLVFLLVTILVSTCIFSEQVVVDGICYDLNSTYSTATIVKNPRLSDGYSGHITIPEKITYKHVTYQVNDMRYAFRNCKNLYSVTLPNTIKSLDFSKCENLTSINIPNSVTSIGFAAFNGCIGLTSITIPNSITSIENYAFSGCTGLTSVTIPNSVKSIGEQAFNDCKSLSSINIPNSITSIGRYAFDGCSSLTSPVYNIHIFAFMPRAYSGSYAVPDGIESIAGGAFNNCNSLTSITIPNSVTSIGHSAFSNCVALKSIVIPVSVKQIGELAFDGCKEIQIWVPGTLEYKYPESAHVIKYNNSEGLSYYYPFSQFAKEYVEKRINVWQQKEEFERTSDWQQRVNENTRKEKIQSLLLQAQEKYIAFHAKEIKINPSLGKYDADNEVFAMYDDTYGNMYMAVPLSEARDFKTNWSSKKLTPQLQIYDDEIKLSALTISMPNGKEYTYRNTDAVNYNLADMEYNFDPIELDLPKTSSAPQQGQRNITTTKVTVGKSSVDANIPTTNASNPNTFVIIFANENYRNVAPVPFAKNDGMIFQKYCQKTLGIPTTNIHYVENASYNDIRIQLAWLNDVCDAFEGQTSIIVYYAGHGIPDEASKSAYLLPVDGDSRYVQSAYKLDDMYQKLGSLKAKNVTVFMDACFSGSKREDGMLASARGVAIKANNGQPTGNMVVFSAATGDQTAYPNNQEGHGMFTYYLLKKLQDTKGDVTYEDLANYIKQNVAQQSIVLNGKSQTPTVTASPAVTDWQSWKLK